MRPEIRALLDPDVGAQMSDPQNYELAQKAWLAVSPGSSDSVAMYFNEEEEYAAPQAIVVTFCAAAGHQCIIYLDDAHMRGTDINFPSGFGAAVTLDPKVTKDRLTQGT